MWHSLRSFEADLEFGLTASTATIPWVFGWDAW